jgi:hypothetical protein
METRSKVKGVPQGIPTTPFVEEVSETLPPAQGTYVTTSNNVSELSLYSCSVLSEVLLSTVVV